MKRRGFFKTLAGLCLAPFVPAAVAAPVGKWYSEWSWTKDLSLYRFGQNKPIPPNTGKMVKFRRYQALGPSTSPMVEGVIPTPNIFQVEWVTNTGPLTIVK